MEKCDVERVVKDHVVREFLFDQPGIELDSHLHLIQEGVVDSLGILKLVSFLEGQFGITISSQEVVIDNFATVEAITTFVGSKLSRSSEGSDATT